jgi:hypothetical protein
MAELAQWRIEAVTIERDADEVYEYAANPANFAEWATSFCQSVRESEAGWCIETTEGEMTLRFAERNPYGIMDHYVASAGGPERANHARVVPAGNGSRVIFTVFQAKDPLDLPLALGCRNVSEDLQMLKSVLESE